MPLKPLVWNGFVYTLSIRRNWKTLFELRTACEIKALHFTKELPKGAGLHIIDIDELVLSAKNYFDTFDNWWTYSCRLCDQYCDFYVMDRPVNDNTFNEFHSTYLNDRTAVQDFAKASRGYVGPDQWTLF